jgi:cell division protein FtsW
MAKRSIIFLILAVALLTGLGITMLASTSFFAKEEGAQEYVTVWKQVMWVGMSLVACLVMALIDYNRWYKWRWWVLGIAGVGLLICYEWHLSQILGFKPQLAKRVNGAARWIGIGSMTLQPSELAKIALIMALAGWFATYQDLERTLRHGLIMPGLIIGGVVLMIGGEVDLGNAAVAAAVGTGIMFVAGTRWQYLASIIGAGIAGLAVGIKYAPNRFERVIAIFDLEKYKDGIGLQQWVSWLAFGSGGIEGRGLGEGRMKLSYLPEAHTDFIFPMVGEELGLWGVIGTVAAFVILIFAGMCISAYAPTPLRVLLIACGGTGGHPVSFDFS